MEHKISDSEITFRGTKRKRSFIYYGQSKEAKNQAFIDFKADKRRLDMEKEREIKPYKHRRHFANDRSYIEYWLNFERATRLRFGI